MAWERGRVNLFQMNPLEVATFLPDWRDAAEPSVRNACVPFWELPILPSSWHPVLRAMDAVMAPSRFVQSACSVVTDPARVIHYPQAVFLPDGVRPARDEWGLGAHRTVFALSFDFRSDIDRKNPWAAIEAFQAAFPVDRDVALVIKTTQSGHPAFSRHAAELRSRVGLDRRIRMIDQALDYSEVLGLYASCDVLLALHRSEGLGLHLMEAMSLGKVVVATNWSGNTDFMTRTNSVPVGYRLVPLQTTHPVYRREEGRPGQVWANADIAEAVQALRRLHADPDHRAAIGLAAGNDMRERQRQVLSGGAFDALESKLAGLPRKGAALPLAVLRTLGTIAIQEVRERIGSTTSRT
jgi:glycosyltransferase involved in cell wall biosynthesis